MPDELGRTLVVDLPDVAEPEGKVDRETRLFEHLAHEPFRDELVALDDSARKPPERFLARSTLKDEDDLVSVANDRRRNLMRGDAD
jgi:hypothetical protein